MRSQANAGLRFMENGQIFPMHQHFYISSTRTNSFFYWKVHEQTHAMISAHTLHLIIFRSVVLLHNKITGTPDHIILRIFILKQHEDGDPDQCEGLWWFYNWQPFSHH